MPMLVERCLENSGRRRNNVGEDTKAFFFFLLVENSVLFVGVQFTRESPARKLWNISVGNELWVPGSSSNTVPRASQLVCVLCQYN